jgi:cation:H+ antiporter
MVWIKFIICGAAILFAGVKLAKDADIIAERSGLGQAWIGLVVLSIITSLPELANTISAVTVVKMPDLAIGDLLGACMFNMFTLAMLDFIQWVSGKPTIFIRPAKRNVIASLFGAIILLTAGLSIFLSQIGFDFVIFGVSIYSLIIIGIYMIAQKKILDEEKKEHVVEEGIERNVSNVVLYGRFALMALLVIAAGCWLPFIGGEMVSTMGWGGSFVAVLFLGLATALPELVVSVSALRMGMVSMSKGNLVGSNIFNLSIIFVADLFYRSGSILASVSHNLIYAALFGAVLMGIAYIALKKQTKTRLTAILLAAVYLLSIFVLFRLGVV